MDTDGLSVICSGLGTLEEDGFENDVYCLDNLKDLLRFLRRDDADTRDVFKQVCKWNIVGKNLIPIIEFCQDDRNLVLNAVKVLVFLTMPIEASSKDVDQQLEYLWSIKSTITSSDVVAVVVSLLVKPLENLECMAFSEDDWKLVQLVLTLFRNILAVQDIPVNQKALGSANMLITLRDDFLERLFKENVMDLIIIITQHIGGSCRYLRHDNLLLLEIYHYIFMGQDPEMIAKASLTDLKVDDDAKASLNSLESIVQEEAAKKRQARLQAGRHAQFGATFTRLTLDGSKTMCKGVPSSASCDKLIKPEKVHKGPSKKVLKDYALAPTTKRSILEMFHEYLNQFLSGGYNVLMQSIIADIEKEHHAIQNSDVLMFFHLAQFATSFQYHKSLMTKHNVEANLESSLSDNDGDDDSTTWFKGDISGPIAATMNESMFGLVIAKWQLAYEGLKQTKNNSFLSVTGSLMKTMIRMLDLVLKLMPERSKEPQTARTILYKLFYDQTDQGLTQFLLNMVRSFDAHKQPKSDLADLVEIMHVVIRLMEKLQAHGTLRVAKKARKARRKKMDDVKNIESQTVEDEATIQNEHQGLSNEEHLDGGIPEKENSTQAGNDGKDVNVGVCVQIDETEKSNIEGPITDSGVIQGDSNQTHENSHVNGAYDCDSSADEQAAATDEVDFKMTSWLIQLASSTIISNLCWLLKFYKSNSTATNHYVVSLLRRICDDLDLAPMLYQLSCLVVFYEILNDQKACPQKEYENLVHFLTSLVRRMLRKMKKQPLLFLDVLFWKSRRDCHYINVESIHHEVGDMRKEVRNWDSGNAGPSQTNGSIRKSLSDALGDDEYDVMVSSEPRHEMDLDLDEAAGDLFQTNDGDHTMKEKYGEGSFKSATRKKRRLVLSSKLEEQIRPLYEMYKDSPDCTQLIAKALDADGTISPAQVSRICKKLGLQLPSRKSVNVAATAQTETTPLTDLNKPDGPSILRKPSHSRKRVRAIDENEELKIKSLFEEFKDHTRCTHMIAKELDPNGTVTAGQVLRKLKKLGLQTSRMRGDSKKQKVDETDASTDEENDSDHLTLSLLRKRSKNDEDASLNRKEGAESNGIQSSGHTSDDELVLSSIVKKSRRGKSELEHRRANMSTAQGTYGQNSGEQIARASEERDVGEQTEEMDTDIETLLHNSPSNSSEHEATGQRGLLLTPVKYNDSTHSDDQASDPGLGSSSEDDATDNPSGEQEDSIPDEHQYNELEDSEDEQRASASPKSSVSRRKLWVVQDFDDDE